MPAYFRRPGRALSVLCVVAFTAPVCAQSTATPPKPPVAAAAAPVEAALPPAQMILDRHVEAIGGRKALAGRTSVRTVGSVTIPANGMTYWVGEAMRGTEYKDLDGPSEEVDGATKLAAKNAAHLAKILRASPYPAG